jgi:hypothetical protein
MIGHGFVTFGRTGLALAETPKGANHPERSCVKRVQHPTPRSGGGQGTPSVGNDRTRYAPRARSTKEQSTTTRTCMYVHVYMYPALNPLASFDKTTTKWKLTKRNHDEPYAP